MKKTGIICIDTVQGNSYKSFKQSTTYITSYSVSIFSVSVLIHSLWSVNPVKQNILVEYFLRIHFSFRGQVLHLWIQRPQSSKGMPYLDYFNQKIQCQQKLYTLVNLRIIIFF